MFNKSKYGNLLTIILIIVIISIIGIIAVIAYKIYNAYYIKKGAAEVVSQFEENVKLGNEATIMYKDFNVIGTIKIPAIDLKYPILKENTTKSLKTSLVLIYTSKGLNTEGNSVIMGHNNRDGTMFSNLDKLKERDSIYITDSTGKEIEYEIYNIYETTENENDYIIRNTAGKKEISLSTSTDDSKTKIIILAKEI